MSGFDILEAENASLRKGNKSLVGRVNRLTLKLQKADKLISDFSQWAAQLSISHRHLVPEKLVPLQETVEIPATTTTSTGYGDAVSTSSKIYGGIAIVLVFSWAALSVVLLMDVISRQ